MESRFEVWPFNKHMQLPATPTSPSILIWYSTLTLPFSHGIIFLRSVLRLLVTAKVVPSSPILVTLMMEAPRSSETSVLTTVTLRNIPEDANLHSRRRENFKSHIALNGWAPWLRRNVFPVRYEPDFNIPEYGILQRGESSGKSSSNYCDVYERTITRILKEHEEHKTHHLNCLLRSTGSLREQLKHTTLINGALGIIRSFNAQKNISGLSVKATVYVSRSYDTCPCTQSPKPPETDLIRTPELHSWQPTRPKN
jgi:hypothetical protein